MLEYPLSRRSFLGWLSAALVAAAPRKPRPPKPPPLSPAPAFRMRQSKLRGGHKLRGGL